MKTAVYPGTFDPVTNGHIDLINRSLSVFGRVVVAVAMNPKKQPLFTLEERVTMIRASLDGIENVEVVPFDSLLIEFCERNNYSILVRGLRAVSDFEFELQMSQMNRKLDEKIETVFMMPSEEYTYISSRLIKEVASYGADVSELVPGPVAEELKKRFA